MSCVRRALQHLRRKNGSLSCKRSSGRRLTFESVERRLILAADIFGSVWNDLNADGLRQSQEGALAGWELYLDSNNNGARDLEVETINSSVETTPITDFNTINSTVSASGLGSPLTDVNVSLSLNHTFAADLDVFLISPAGTRVELFTDVGGRGNNFSNTTLDDQASVNIISGSTPFAGTFRPEGSLSILNGEVANGIWTLELTDDANFDDGEFIDWSLFLTGVGEATAVSDSHGNYVFSGLPAGSHTIRELVRDTWRPTVPAGGAQTVNVANGEILVGVDFGNESQTGQIRGRLWNDIDGHGTQQVGEAGLPGWSVHLDLNDNGLVDQQSRAIVSSDTPIGLTDLATIVSQINVSGFGNAVTDVDVTLSIGHTWNADLEAYLISPAGSRVELFSDVGGGGDNFSATILDDAAATSIRSGAAPFAGSFRPAGALSAFVGEDADGVWTLEITDDFGADTGELISWTLHLSNQSELGVLTDTNGDFAITGLSPGSYTVRQVLPEGWTQTFPLDSAVHTVAVEPGQVIRNVDFGSQLQQSPRATIEGTVWEDDNGDGVRQAAEAGLEDRWVFLDMNSNRLYDQDRLAVSSIGPAQALVDFETLTSQLTVSGFAGPISDLDVTLSIDHTYDTDLDVFLTSPSGTRVELFTDVGGAGDNFSSTTLDDQAATALPSAAAPFAGRFQPEGVLSDFDGEDANGIWTLEITDDAELDTGRLVDWRLDITGEVEPSRETDGDGGYVFAGLAAGEYSIRLIQATVWEQTFPTAGTAHNVAVSAGQVLSRVSFGNESRLAEIHGTVWNDWDSDAVRNGGESGLSGRRVYIDENGNGVHDRQLISVGSGDIHQPLADLTTTLSDLAVAGFAGPIADVNVALHIDHTWDADLDVFLIGPSGTRVELFTDVGGSGDNFFDTTLDDQASRSVTDVVAPFISSMRPEGLLADFNGEDANGTWTLEVTDDAGQDTGELIEWSLTIASPTEPLSITDANGGYSFTDLPAGTYTVAQQLPAHWIQTSPSNGPSTIQIQSGTVIQDADFGSNNSQPSVQLLPDFSVLADRDDGYLYGWTIDTTAQPGNRLLRFSTAVANIGEGPGELLGGDINADGTQDVVQRIYNTDGNFTERLAGTFIYHPGHGHIHFDGYAIYFLRAVTQNNGVGNVVASGEKVSFCLLDSVAPAAGLPGAPSTAHYGGCGQVQGISVGWADLYGLHLPDQWIDISGVPDGPYWLEVVVDPENRLTESDETNNATRILIELRSD